MSFGDKPDWKRRALDAEAALERAIKALDHYTTTPEDAEVMRRYIHTGKRPMNEQEWAEAMIARWT